MGVRGFCGGSKPPPYAMMGVALDRYLPGRNTMLANDTMYRRIISIFKIDASEGIFDSGHCFHFFNVGLKSDGISDTVKSMILDVTQNIVAVMVRVRKIVVVDRLIHERIILISVFTERKVIFKQGCFIPFVQHLVGFVVIVNGRDRKSVV